MCDLLSINAWEMLAADILEVPVSHKNHCYLLVVMDYSIKWVEAILLHDQTAAWVTNCKVIIKICSTLGVPSILHSNQGYNFKSHMLQQMLQAFYVHKSCTITYHPWCDGVVEQFICLLQQLL